MSKKVVKKPGKVVKKSLSLDDVVNGEYEIIDGMVNVNGSVEMNNMFLTEIPWKFGEVTGSFNCGHNNLTSLKNAPHTVGLHFYCFFNKLKTLEFCPISINGVIHCSGNPFESFDNVPLNILTRIAGIERFDMVTMIPVPKEKIPVVAKALKINLNKKKIISLKERLRIIGEE